MRKLLSVASSLVLALLLLACAPPIAARGPICDGVDCSESHTSRHSRVEGASLSGLYAFPQSVRYVLRFESGDVFLNNVRLEPGCRVQTAQRRDQVRFVRATGVLLEAPVSADACAP